MRAVNDGSIDLYTLWMRQPITLILVIIALGLCPDLPGLYLPLCMRRGADDMYNSQ